MRSARRKTRNANWSRQKIYESTSGGCVTVGEKRYLTRRAVRNKYGWGLGTLTTFGNRIHHFRARIRQGGRLIAKAWIYAEADCDEVFGAEPQPDVPTPHEWERIRSAAPPERMQLYDAAWLAPNIPEWSLMRLNVEDVELEGGEARIIYRSRNGEVHRARKLRSAFIRHLKDIIGNRCRGPVFSHSGGRRFNHESLKLFWRQDCLAAGVRPGLIRRKAEAYRYKAAEQRPGWTIREIADAANVCYQTARGACDPNIGHLSVGKNEDGSYKHIRKIKATYTDPVGHDRSLYNKRDASKFIRSFNHESSPPEGHLFMDEQTAQSYGWSLAYLRWLYYSEQVDGKDCVRLIGAGGGQTDYLIETKALNKDQLDEHANTLNELQVNRGGFFLVPEFAKETNCKPPAAYSRIEDQWWTDLQRALAIPYEENGSPKRHETVVGWKRSKNLVQGLRILIPKSEATLINAVNLVWIPVTTVARELGTARLQLVRGCKDGRIARTNTDLSFSTCRKFFHRPDRNFEYRLHASVVVEMAERMNKPEVAEECRKRLSQTFTVNGIETTAEQLAEEALAHWTPDAPPAEPDPPAGTTPEDQDDDGTGESGGGKLAEDAPMKPKAAKHTRTKPQRKLHLWMRQLKRDGKSLTQIAQLASEKTGRRVARSTVQSALERLEDDGDERCTH